MIGCEQAIALGNTKFTPTQAEVFGGLQSGI